MKIRLKRGYLEQIIVYGQIRMAHSTVVQILFKITFSSLLVFRGENIKIKKEIDLGFNGLCVFGDMKRKRKCHLIRIFSL